MDAYDLLVAFTKGKEFSSEEDDLIEQILEKLNRISLRHKKIIDLNSKINTELTSRDFDLEELRKITKKILIKKYGFPEDSEPLLKSSSSAFGIDDKNLMSDDEQTLEDMVIRNYEDMWRILEICNSRISELKFKVKGVTITRNKLVVHSGTKPKHDTTHDSFVVTSNGPIVKGSRSRLSPVPISAVIGPTQ
jgi:uncharacterized protein (UPF0335 family)